MLPSEWEYLMSTPKPKYPPHDPGQEQEQEQSQAQAQLQFAVQSLDSKSDNDNDNDNKNSNKNDNDNKLDNDVDNKLNNKASNDVDNKLDNKVSNDIDNSIDNKIDNKVNVDVDVSVDLDLKADGLSSPVIDLSNLHDVESSIIMPDVVNQKLDGNGNQFNIDQVNNLVDNDHNTSSASYDGGDFEMHAKAEGGHVDIDSKIGDIAGNAASGVAAHADAAITQSAFDQTITQGANIQFNSITMNVAGDDFHDSHDLG